MRSTPSGGSRKREYSFAGRFRPPAKHRLSHSATGRIASGLPAALARVLGGSWISMCSRWSTDDAASQKRARRDRDGFSHAPVVCADCPGQRTRCRGSGPTRACAGPEHDLLPRNTGSGTAPIPFGGQTGRSICRGNRDSALICKAKQPRDRVLIMPFDISPDTASRALGRVKHGGKTVIGSQIGGR